jgi:hypothetical protein
MFTVKFKADKISVSDEMFGGVHEASAHIVRVYGERLIKNMRSASE